MAVRRRAWITHVDDSDVSLSCTRVWDPPRRTTVASQRATAGHGDGARHRGHAAGLVHREFDTPTLGATILATRLACLLVCPSGVPIQSVPRR